MSNLDIKMEASTQEQKNCTNNFSNNTILNNSFRPTNIMPQNNINPNPNIQPKVNFPFPYIINPALFNNPNFKQCIPKCFKIRPH